MLRGRVTTGAGECASFTRVAWAREQFIAKLGIDPYPGTLNLLLDSPTEITKWNDLKERPGVLVNPPEPNWCTARCYPIRINGWLPGAIVLPDVPGYPETRVEIIAALPLREKLPSADGDEVSVDFNDPLSVRAVLFDVDGTLLDSIEAYRVVAERAAAPFRIPITREVVRHALNTNHSNFWDLVVSTHQPDRTAMMEGMTAETFRLWPEVLRQHGTIFPGLLEMLEVLRHRALRLGIVTGSFGTSLEPLREFGVLDFFEVIVTGQDVERRKPDPEGLLKCVAALGVEPQDTVHVGDTIVDVQASRAAGMASVAVLSGAGDSASLSAHGPDWIIHSHARLPEILSGRNDCPSL